MLGAPITSYAITTAPAHGSAALNAATGAVTYTPAPGYSGPDSFTFDATSSHGTGAAAAATITVAARPPVVAVPPNDSKPVLSPKTFAALTRGASIAKAARGTTVTYTDTQSATTTFTVRKAARGGRALARTLRRTPARHKVHGKRCARFTTLGTFSHTDVAGANRFRFSRPRPRARAQARLIPAVSAPTNAARKTGTAHVNSFRIVSG